MLKNTLFLLIILILSACSIERSEKYAKPRGDYLGQAAPGMEPQVFAPGFISTGLYTRDITMTPALDEIYYCVNVGNYKYSAIMVTKRINNVWTTPQVTEFSANPLYMDLEPFISPDGKRLFFLSDRPDTARGETEKGDEDIWVMDREDSGWGEPYNLGEPVNTEDEEYFPSLTTDGTLYFTRQPKGSQVGYIYRSRFLNGRYSEPEKLPEQVNSGRAQYNAFIAPDESYLIVPVYGRDDSMGSTDYYVVYRDKDDNWSNPVNMAEKINTTGGREYSPYVSPDGKYFFFMSARPLPPEKIPAKMTYESMKKINNSPQNGNPGIYWIDAKIINDLKPPNFK